jgi:GNAT superfamily N-acetyltransferase
MRLELHRATGPTSGVRRARFEDAPELLRLIERAVEAGCARDYRPAQRRAVFLSYAETLFLDILGPAETFVAEAAGRPIGMAQLRVDTGRLSALFVDRDLQGHGVGYALLGWVLAHATKRRLRRVHGAMSLNAVPFYARAGFQPCAGRRQLIHQGVVVPVLPMERFLEA